MINPSCIEVIENMVRMHIQQPPLQQILLDLIHSKMHIQQSLHWSQVVLDVHSMLGGRSQQIIRVAAAIELVMLALDVMDDFQDGDFSKHTQVFMDAKNSYTVILSLIMIGCNECAVVSQPSLDVLHNVLQKILASIGGQHLDLNPVENTEVEYFNVIELKSGSLLQLAVEAGTYQTECSDEQRQALLLVAKYAGMYQQLHNDVRDVFRWDDKNDMIQRKRTFPVHFLLEQAATHHALKPLKEYYEGVIDFQQLAQSKVTVYQAMKRSKIEEACLMLSQKWKVDSERVLLSADFRPQIIQAFLDLLFP